MRGRRCAAAAPAPPIAAPASISLLPLPLSLSLPQDAPRLLGAWLDITQQQNTRETLHALEMRLSLMFEDQTELICHFLPSGVLTFANDAYCRYFGKTQEELIGRSFIPLIPDEDMERVSQSFAALNASAPVGSVEHRVITADGALRWHSWTNRAILDDEGRIIEYQAVGRDITEQKLAEARIRQLNADLTRRAAELEAANAELEAFSFTASHDLRAPLRTIGSFCRLIEESHAGCSTREARTTCAVWSRRPSEWPASSMTCSICRGSRARSCASCA